jgi:hypothetical protein
MRYIITRLQSTSAYGQNRNHHIPKGARELAQAHEERTWIERLHVTKEGYVFIPPMQFKLCLENTARYIGMQIPGKGKSTYTKHFVQGVIVPEGRCCDRPRGRLVGRVHPANAM